MEAATKAVGEKEGMRPPGLSVTMAGSPLELTGLGICPGQLLGPGD